MSLFLRWAAQQVRDADDKAYTAYVNGATNWMGLQFHAEAASRIANLDHDHKLNEKIADLQFIIQPQLVAIDAITAGEGRMLTPTPSVPARAAGSEAPPGRYPVAARDGRRCPVVRRASPRSCAAAHCAPTRW